MVNHLPIPEKSGRRTDLFLDIVVRVCNDLDIFDFLTLPTLSSIDGNGGMDKNVIYAILHESIYCQG